MTIITQLFGVLGMVFLFLVYQQKSRKGLLVSKLCADVCWSAHYLCLGAYGGVIPNFVGIFRELIFVQREQKKWANLFIWPCLFIVINWCLGIKSFSAPINILPICASTAVTLSLWFKRPIMTKIILASASTAFLIYDVFVGAYVGIVNESISILSVIIFFIKRRKKND